MTLGEGYLKLHQMTSNDVFRSLNFQIGVSWVSTLRIFPKISFVIKLQTAGWRLEMSDGLDDAFDLSALIIISHSSENRSKGC